MQESDMDDMDKEQTTDDSAEEDYSTRKDRPTPRQLWKSSQQADNEATNRRLKVRPVEDESQEAPERGADNESEGSGTNSGEADAPESPTELSADRQSEEIRESSPGAPEDVAAEGEAPPEEQEEPEATSDADELPEPALVSEDATKDAAAGASAEGEPEEEATEEKAPARMVEDDQQPGMMRYPYATHGPAPEEGADGEGADRMVSSSFVLGLLIILGALLTGLALVTFHRRFRQLENRVERLESVVSSQNPRSGVDIESASR
jgi:hypothetical protein